MQHNLLDDVYRFAISPPSAAISHMPLALPATVHHCHFVARLTFPFLCFVRRSYLVLHFLSVCECVLSVCVCLWSEQRFLLCLFVDFFDFAFSLVFYILYSCFFYLHSNFIMKFTFTFAWVCFCCCFCCTNASCCCCFCFSSSPTYCLAHSISLSWSACFSRSLSISLFWSV